MNTNTVTAVCTLCGAEKSTDWDWTVCPNGSGAHGWQPVAVLAVDGVGTIAAARSYVAGMLALATSLGASDPARSVSAAIERTRRSMQERGATDDEDFSWSLLRLAANEAL